VAGRVWFPKDYISDEKCLKQTILECTKKFDCVKDVKVQTTVHLPNKYFTDVTIYVNEALYVAYLLSGGKKIEVLVKNNLKSQHPINIRIISK
jgi:divalent metal cation (Fe/Co/Zn/Cd) transporter